MIFYVISPHNREENKCSKYLIIMIIYIVNLLFTASNYARTTQDHNNLFYWPFLYFLIDQYAIDYIFLYISMKYSLIRYAKFYSIKASPNQWIIWSTLFFLYFIFKFVLTFLSKNNNYIKIIFKNKIMYIFFFLFILKLLTST